MADLTAPLARNLWLLAASFLAGGMNAMAGGGSLLSFPAMLGVGVPPIQANATNTVALWPGQATSIFGYRQDVGAHPHLLGPVILAGAAGGTLGAFLLLHTQGRTFLRLVPWLLLIAALLFWISEPVSNWLKRRRTDDVSAHPWLLFLSLFAVCCYIGYFGAGSGILIMALLAIFGVHSMSEINALKVIGTTLANGAAVVTFIARGAVVWNKCIFAMVMAALGGWIGSRLARRMNARALRIVVIATGFATAAYFFWRAN